MNLPLASSNTRATAYPELYPGFILLLVASVLPAIGLFLLGKPILAAAALGIPIIVLLVGSPKYSFYLFLLSVSLYLPYHLKGWAIHPFDLAMIPVFAAVVADFLLHGRSQVRRTGLDLAFLVWILAAAVSAVFAYDYRYSLFPLARLIVMYFAFRIVFKMAGDLGVRRVVLFYVYQVFALSVLNCIIFVMTAGTQRVFGPPWLAFETYSMTALPMALAFFIWAGSRAERIRLGLISLVIFLAILATQSRAPMLAVAINVPILMILAYYKIRREQSAQAVRTLGRILVFGGMATVLVLALSSTLLIGSFGRVSELVASLHRPQGTVALRLVLWTAAIKGFLTNPITGVGIGNFKVIEQIVPQMRMAPVWYYIRTMSAHNVVLQYLAETGILGTLALIALAVANVRMGYRSFRKKLSPADNQISAALLIAALVFLITIFYMRAWTWGQGGYIMAILFGMNAAWNWRNRKTGVAS